MNQIKMEDAERLTMANMPRQPKNLTAAARKAAATAALRAQLHLELENRKPCSYQPHDCSQLTLDGYDYCLRHIMEDKSAPYRQCSYVYNGNGKRCHLPAPKGDKKDYGYCSEHALKSHLLRVRMGSRHQPMNTTETLLSSLSHYVNPNRPRSNSTSIDPVDDDTTESDTEEMKVSKSLDPFSDINAAEINAGCSDVLDFASESESDVDASTYNSVWHDAHGDSSDDESIDSEQEDVLKHAGVYTAEEITLVTRDKLIRLQSLYIEQFKHLQHTLRERRRKYLQALKREKETLCSIHDQPKETIKEQRLYKKLKALNNYHRKSGIDAIMSKKCTELRAKLTEGMNSKPQSFTKCTFSEGGVKCIERAMPVAKYCRKHILNDPSQVLYKRCGRIQADIECNEPVLSIFNDSTCRFHMDFPSPRNYGERWKDEESDVEDSSDTTQPAESISQVNTPRSFMDIDTKQEFPDYNIDMLAPTSSNEPPTPPQLSNSSTFPTPPQLLSTSFANRFPTDKSELSTMKDILEMENASLDYLKDVNELDVETVEENMVKEEIKEEMEEVERSMNIDPDDDMAGIMMELQKDREKQTDNQN